MVWWPADRRLAEQQRRLDNTPPDARRRDLEKIARERGYSAAWVDQMLKREGKS